MAIVGVFETSVLGRTRVTGTIERGFIKVKQRVELVGIRSTITTVVTGLFLKLLGFPVFVLPHF